MAMKSLTSGCDMSVELRKRVEILRKFDAVMRKHKARKSVRCLTFKRMLIGTKVYKDSDIKQKANIS